MNEFKNDSYLADFEYFSLKLNNFVDIEIPYLLDEGNINVKNVIDKTLIQTTKSALSSHAKRIRPMICFWIFRNFYFNKNFNHKISDFNLNENKILTDVTKIALSIEILHCASLVVDDIEDGSKERRGQKSLHIKYGIPYALNTSNWMYFLAIKSIPNKLKTSAIDALFDCHVGQSLDLSSKDNEITIQHFLGSDEDRWNFYEKCSELKTTRLINFAFNCMNKLLKVDQNNILILEKIFKNYGLIYQIFDDIKNFIPEMSREKLYEDLSSGLRSAVVLSFLEILSVEEKSKAFNELIDRSFPKFLLTHPKKYHALEKCFYKATCLINTNFIQIESLNISKPSREYLSGIIEKPFEDIKNNIFNNVGLNCNNFILNENVSL